MEPEKREPERRGIPEPAGVELRLRFSAQKAAEQRLADYVAGLSLALAIDPARVAGFDDDTCELLLVPEVEVA